MQQVNIRLTVYLSDNEANALAEAGIIGVDNPDRGDFHVLSYLVDASISNATTAILKQLSGIPQSSPHVSTVLACGNGLARFEGYDTCRNCGDLIGVRPQDACPEGFARCFCKRPIIAEKHEPWDTCFTCGGAVNLRGDCDPILCDCAEKSFDAIVAADPLPILE